jgi:hypothetical protein
MAVAAGLAAASALCAIAFIDGRQAESR